MAKEPSIRQGRSTDTAGGEGSKSGPTGGKSQGDLVSELLADLPQDAKARLRAIGDIYLLLRRHVKDALTPAVTDMLRHSVEVSYAERIEMAREINQVLTDARLAIRNPQSRLPAMVEVQRPRGDSYAYLRIQDTRSAANERRKHLSVEKLKRENISIDLIDVSNRANGLER